MLRLKDAVDEKIQVIIQGMLMRFLHSSTALYEADGTNVYSVFGGQYCSFLNSTSLKNSGSSKENVECSGQRICHEECLRISKEAMDKREPVEKTCSGGINIYAVPIVYKHQVVGSINAGVTNPPIDRAELETIAGIYKTDVNRLMQRAYTYKRLTEGEIDIARMHVRMAALLIESLYETRIKQLEAEEEVRRQNELIKEKSMMAEEQKKQLQAIIENMSDGVFLLDRNNKFTLLNNGAREFFYKPESIHENGDSLAYTEYYDADGKLLTVADLPGTRTLKGETLRNFLLTVKRPDKTVHYSINSSPMYDDSGTIENAIICVRDITKKIEQKILLKEKKEQLELIMENMSEALFIFDKNGKYILVNKAARNRIGLDVLHAGDSFKFIEYFDLDGNRIPFEDTPNYHALQGRAVAEKVMFLKSSDLELYISVSGSPIFDEKGNLLYGVVTGRDVTEKVRYEQMIRMQQERLLKAEKAEKEVLEKAMKMKDEFLATITHEFKTPLTVINAALQTIDNIYGAQVSDNIKKHLQRIRTNSFRQLRLVNNLLDITRYNAGHFKINKRNLDIIFLSNAIVKSVDLYARQKGVELKFLSDCKYKEMAVDEEKYERILLNLLSNAIKFTPKGKSIYVNLSCKNRKVVLTVRDEGMGIPKSKQKLIFERFGQVDSSLSRQSEGSGIGLSLVKTLVQGMKGTVKVESKLGKGSTFTVEFPITKLRRSEPELAMIASSDSRIMQATIIEFSDIYID